MPMNRRLNAVQQKLAASYIPRAYGLVNWFVRGNPSLRREADDAAIDGVMLAAAEWKQNGTATFETFAFMVVRHRLLAMLERRNTRQRRFERSVAPFSIIYADDPTGDDFAENVPTRAETPSCFGEAMLGFLRRVLTYKQLVVVLPHYVEGLTATEIARRMGVTPQCVSFNLRQAHDRLRACWPEDRHSLME